MNFFDFVDNLEKYPASQFLDELQDELEKSEDVKTLQIRQWDDGLDADGDLLGRYSYWTSVFDPRKKYNEPYDINDTGETRRNTHIVGFQENKDLSLFFDSRSQALSDLLETIGERLFGLNGKSMDKLVDISQDMGIELLNKNLKL